MLISIIIPTLNENDNIQSVLDHLTEQTGDFEIIVVDDGSAGDILALIKDQAQLVTAQSAECGAQFNAGAAAATGDVLLFLDPGSHLSSGALLAIERNFNLLPQTIGGSFHLKFDRETLFTKLLVRFLKWWRYRGNYFSHGGIFIRKDIYQIIGGFQPNLTLADYDFTQRMEMYGPTLYLPEVIIAPTPNGREVLAWLIAPIFQKRKTQ